MIKTNVKVVVLIELCSKEIYAIAIIIITIMKTLIHFNVNYVPPIKSRYVWAAQIVILHAPNVTKQPKKEL